MVAKGPLFRGDDPGFTAWECSAFSMLGLGSWVGKFQSLVKAAAEPNLKVYPGVCTHCQGDPFYSWSPGEQCVYCHNLEQCLLCGNHLVHQLTARGMFCEGDGDCIVMAKLCGDCLLEAGWGKCGIENCVGECCPNCVKPCDVCGTLSAMCDSHVFKCGCSHLCLGCLERAKCEVCGVSMMNGVGASRDGKGCEMHICSCCCLHVRLYG
ncbi:hypothetical protein M427DRAFT_371522 [Gonapodya prolifera JEL478]|uniref:Uncharacterized protein n=1 Tax=Gonapodya prolifera (strain JEL478) TaxID=1344416 RepID=A0A139A9E4_GONPJ|nr:hypothetical protein M427DRAFT_371522 [Gonapodya prolifera JEL478]|eukprot:KXS13420.1 hypothetical protein M427DRAFT_371522 [Gonapodya prolifera JEL478]